MRHSGFLALTVALTGLALGCETTQQAASSPSSIEAAEPIETDTATLIVHGMGCPLCANNVDKQLKDVPGVRDVAVDMGTGRVLVHLDPDHRPTRAQLLRAVRESGFTPVRLDTP